MNCHTCTYLVGVCPDAKCFLDKDNFFRVKGRDCPFWMAKRIFCLLDYIQ